MLGVGAAFDFMQGLAAGTCMDAEDGIGMVFSIGNGAAKIMETVSLS